ncbi:MAG: type II toxin-antitoxin system RelE/ParE family toxin [Oscillospiraceae bacterium]|nr:type II toxin-antitoxin system RelE/ParE family toxin [Oscillospiraceae bacterium]
MYCVEFTKRFEQDIDYYRKKKKYHHIEDDISSIIDNLENGELIGNEISGINLEMSGHTYKVRAVNTDTKSGKSDGYRVIYYAVQDDKTVFLLTIYSKKDDIRIPTNNEIIGIIEQYC